MLTKRQSISAALLALFVLLLAACGPSCEETTADYIDQIDDLVSRWNDAVAIADTTPRGVLATPISNLQEIRRDAEDLEPPLCGDVHTAALDTKLALIAYMEQGINLYLEFAADADADLGPAVREYDNLHTLFERAYRGLK